MSLDRPVSINPSGWGVPRLRILAPGLILASAVAAAAVTGERLLTPVASIPAMVLALVIGIAFNGVAKRPAFSPGLQFSVKSVLRCAVALLGLRISLGEIMALGAGTAVIVVCAMVATIAFGILVARVLKLSEYYGALAGAGTAVCGASATLATAAILPAYRGKEADVAFVVIGVNALSTVAMVLYPELCRLLGMDHTLTGILLGATIHDVAQVAGAGYSVSEKAGDTAVIVKLFRVLLLFPTVVIVAWHFLGSKSPLSSLRSSLPGFALVFLVLCVANTVLSGSSSVAGIYEPVKSYLTQASAVGLLVAIGALGLATSPSDVARLGWRHVAALIATTVLILGAIVAGLSSF